MLAILLLYDGKNEVAKIPRICEGTIKECLADGIKKGAILPRSKSV